MPCEGCEVQFTVFRRKRICFECRRYYCNNCLTKQNSISLCNRCIIFTKRPLHKNDLQQLKPKDLIFYLQSKHISTTGCVEKDELVNLILNHVNSTDSHSTDSDRAPSYAAKAGSGEAQNPFDNIKQSCQNFFNTVSEKISNDFSFENMKSPSNPQSNTQSNISDQPRISTREIPSYSSYNQGDQFSSSQNSRMPNSGASTDNQSTRTQSPSIHGVNNTSTTISTPSSDPSSPVISISSISSQSISSQTHHQNRQIPTSSFSPSTSVSQKTSRSTPQDPIPLVHNCANNKNRVLGVMNDANNLSGCECSDDEVITKYKTRKSSKVTSPSSENPIAGPSSGTCDNFNKSSVQNSPKQAEESGSGSSFEELGAVGGSAPFNLSDGENWQFVKTTENEGPIENSALYPTHSNESESIDQIGNEDSISVIDSQPINSNDVELSSPLRQRQRRVLRRRSDGYILNQNRSRRSLNAGNEFPSVDEGSDAEDGSDTQRNQKRTCRNCSKCGKSKNNLKRHVAKFKRLLESSKMSEADIKQELDEFLTYLENREASFECSDSELSVSVQAPNEVTNAVAGNSRQTEPIHFEYDYGYEADMFFGNDDDGIHVYAQNDNQTPANTTFDSQSSNIRPDSRFINLKDFQSSDQFEELSVKQLKKILMVNRVDYKGCCEKQELLERVNRLWNNYQTSPAIEKLPTDELCKICMDAPIECVILECGHMATCTSCGKVLSECPICRQYIVRVVRFFRA